MRLTGKVTRIESADGSSRGFQKITIKVDQSKSPMYDSFVVANDQDEFTLDQKVTIDIQGAA
jgi:hypothetical protein